MRRAGRVVAEMHEATRAAVRPGVTTAELDAVAREVLDAPGGRSNFLNYHGFPAVICTSPNDMIVHGIPGDYVLQRGRHHVDRLRGDRRGLPRRRRLHRAVGEVSARGPAPHGGDRALAVGRDRAAQRSGNRLHEVGRAVQEVAEAAGFSVVREYVGHAIGTAMHEEPQVPNYWPGSAGPDAEGGHGLRRRADGQRRAAPTPSGLDDGWSVMTADGSLSAHFEHTIAVTDDGPEVLTAALRRPRRRRSFWPPAAGAAMLIGRLAGLTWRLCPPAPAGGGGLAIARSGGPPPA